MVELTSSLDSGLQDLLPLLSSQKNGSKSSSDAAASKALLELKRQEIQKQILIEKQTQRDLESAVDSLSNL